MRKRKISIGLSGLFLFLISLIISVFVCEIILRHLMFSHSSLFILNPHSFSNYYESDDAYRIFLKRDIADGRLGEKAFAEFDSVLGWNAEAVTPKNPLGIVTNKEYSLDELGSEESLLFFGDSFIEGSMDEIEDKLPQVLDKLVDKYSVLNLGVRGYGLDQMYLKLERVIGFFNRPRVMIGLIFADIDRCIFRVFHAPKPYFTVAEENLVLQGTPIAYNPTVWLSQFPIGIRSYTFAGFKGLLRRLMVSRWGVIYFFNYQLTETSSMIHQKKLICGKLITKIKEVCDRHNASLTFVIFPNRESMIHKGWYLSFLEESFSELNIDFIDLTEPLKRYLKRNDLQWYKDLYRRNDHPDAEENRLIARIIANHLEKQSIE